MIKSWTASVVVALALLAALATPARADKVDDLVRDLRTGSDYKIRLSAALSLAKLGDKRSTVITAFQTALKDSDKTVRGAAAVALAKLVDADTPSVKRDLIMKDLSTMIAKETSDSVKKQAEKSLATIKAIGSGGGGDSSTSVGAGAVYIDVGPMSSKTSDEANNAKLKTLMRSTTEKTFKSKGQPMMLTWPGGKSPTRKDLDAKKASGFHVDGTLTEMTVKEKGSAATVSCKVSMLIATYPEKSVFGFLNGGASVTASSDPGDIKLAGEDCLAAVVEDLVAKKIIPTIKIKAGL